MPLNTLKNLPNMHKGILYIIGGVLILLYAFGLFQPLLNIVVITGGFLMLLYGLDKTGSLQKLKQLFGKK